MAHHNLRLILVAVLISAGLGLLIWPSRAQSAEPLPFIEPRDPIGLAERAAPLNRAAPIEPAAPLGADPFSWSKIAFMSYRDKNEEIYFANGDGGNATRLTLNSKVDDTPALDRGAQHIVFVSNRDGNAEVYRMNVDGSDLKRLTNTAANEYLPAWSPDGQRIAFYSYRDGNAEIYVMNADGTNQTRLTFDAAWDGHPTWSPDGQQIAFASQRTSDYELFKMSADGSAATQLTSGATSAAYPDWSPDGSTLLFNYDAAPGDGFYDVAKVSADGGAHTLVTLSPTNVSDRTPKWDPTGQYYAYAQSFWTFSNNRWVLTAANIPVRDPATSQDIAMLANSGIDMSPSWKTVDNVAPASQVAALPVWLNTTPFTVTWSGTDPAPSSDIASYDVQVRDGSGVWTDWLTQTAQISADFTGQPGHTYAFRVRARDYAHNLENYPAEADTTTTLYRYELAGKVLDTREQPIGAAQLTVTPPSIETAFSDQHGDFLLHFIDPGPASLSVSRSGYGPLPPLNQIAISTTSDNPIVYLPPIDDAIADGHFESGTLSAWNVSGDVVIPVITSTAHTGDYAVQLGGPIALAAPDGSAAHSIIAQTVSVSPTGASGTLSLMYRVVSTDPLYDTLTAYVMGVTDTLTFTLPMTATAWTHAWFDVSAWSEPTATVQIDLAAADVAPPTIIILDEITWGSVIDQSHLVFLPLIRR